MSPRVRTVKVPFPEAAAGAFGKLKVIEPPLVVRFWSGVVKL